MSDWLLNATRLFRRQAEAPDVSYELRCGCGQALSGDRIELPQVVECPECRQSRFILPSSPYPEPKPARSRESLGWLKGAGDSANVHGPAHSKSRHEPADPAGVELILSANESDVDPPAESKAAPKPRRSVEPESRLPERRPVGQRKTLSSPGPRSIEPVSQRKPAERLAVVSVEGVRLRRSHTRGRLLTPVRLVVAIMVAVGFAGAWWLHRELERSRAEQALAESGRSLTNSLEKGEIQAAAADADRVLSAMAILERDEPRALALRQTARETIAAARLSRSSFGELLREAVNSRNSSSATWDEVFRSQHRGGWIVMDAPVSLTAAELRRMNFRIDCPVASDAVAARVTGDFLEFGRLPLSVDEPRRVIFAAQLQGIHPDPKTSSEWVIELNPQSAFLWVGADSLAALGFAIDQETRLVLRQQAELLGMSP